LCADGTILCKSGWLTKVVTVPVLDIALRLCCNATFRAAFGRGMLATRLMM
jgi:hypothetical protein